MSGLVSKNELTDEFRQELESKSQTITMHEEAKMPHYFTDSSNKKYRYGFKVSGDSLTFIYEEVL